MSTQLCENKTLHLVSQSLHQRFRKATRQRERRKQTMGGWLVRDGKMILNKFTADTRHLCSDGSAQNDTVVKSHAKIQWNVLSHASSECMNAYSMVAHVPS